ncbi:hypothetical protein SLA_7219 [Streptomyces laurentii]|uniref:Uncharacterized protein n=1 Tax=Streptomyces laurentii TaxID=39478 RepID=A0A160P9P8_STRLU|nr:hypothetical protein SLA_7219 [Streptomyces laurentii]
MGERVFTIDDLAETDSVCVCLSCRLGAAFAQHLTDLRTGFPGQVTALGHRGAGPERTAVPHLVALRLGKERIDAVVWEEMTHGQLAAWLPYAEARARVPQLARRIPRLVAIRQALRAGTFTPTGEVAAALDSGRYPSFRFFVEHWPQINKEFSS